MAIPALTGNEQSLISFTASVTDPDIAPGILRYSLGSDAPANAEIAPDTGIFEWTPEEADGPGEYLATVIVARTDDPELTDSHVVAISVLEVNRPPEIGVIEDRVIDEVTELVAVGRATDPDIPGDEITFSFAQAPDNAEIDATTGAMTWTPSEDQGPGTYDFEVAASDNGTPSLTSTTTFVVEVRETNSPPGLSTLEDIVGDEGTPLTFTASATDSDTPANSLVFTLGPDAPTGASIDPDTGVFEWTPTEETAPELRRSPSWSQMTESQCCRCPKRFQSKCGKSTRHLWLPQSKIRLSTLIRSCCCGYG